MCWFDVMTPCFCGDILHVTHSSHRTRQQGVDEKHKIIATEVSEQVHTKCRAAAYQTSSEAGKEPLEKNVRVCVLMLDVSVLRQPQ